MKLNDVLLNIHSRRSVRKFLSRQLDEEQLSAIIEAGRAAPSGGNSQSAHLLVIQSPEALEKLRAAVEAEFSKMEADEHTYKSLRNSIAASKKGGYHFHYDAPTLIVAANRRGYGNALADTSCMLENMMLAASSLGVGSCWINQLHWLDENAAIRGILCAMGLEETETVCGGLALGYPAASMEGPSPVKRTGNSVTYIR